MENKARVVQPPEHRSSNWLDVIRRKEKHISTARNKNHKIPNYGVGAGKRN